MSTEYEIQKSFVKWARQSNDPRLEFLYAPPNESRRTWAHAQKRRSEGMLAGVPDLHLPLPVRSQQHPHLFKAPGLFIETKTPNGNLSPKQQAFKDFCDKVGYPYRIVRSTNEGIDTLTEYLNY